MNAINMQQLGRRVAAERILKGWTQAELAERAELTQASIARIERGRNPGLRVDTLFSVAQALEVKTDYLMGLDDRKESDLEPAPLAMVGA